jgi:single-strand DNA-binding protein
MINRVILVGRLTQEPQMRKTQTGKSVCAFSLAVDRRRSSNSSNQNTQTVDFINCVAWEKTAELMCSYLHKGSQIGVEGRIQTRNYDDPNIPGRKVYVTEVYCENITFLESRSTSESRQNSVVNNASTPYYPDDTYDDMADQTPTLKISADDLPF